MIEIPGYKIKREIGHGGMAKVYLATHEGLQRDVAIKVMIKNLGKDDSYSERFLREARIVAQMSHQNIITVFDVGVHNEHHYIAMELLPGETLEDKIKEGLTPEQALRLLKQISTGLQYAHDKKFIHRDIKPENILFREDDSPVISDFGIARYAESDTRMTEEGTVIGTAIYMSPEQAQGHQISNCADIYSLGIIFHEMLTGRVPYTADSSIGIAFKHIKDPLPTLEKRFARHQPILDKLLAKRPEDRFQSCQEIVEAIDTFNKKAKTNKSTELIDRNSDQTEFINLNSTPKSKRYIFPIALTVLLASIITAYTMVYIPYKEKLNQEEIARKVLLEEKQEKKARTANEKKKEAERQRLAEEERKRLAIEEKARLDKLEKERKLAEQQAAEEKTRIEAQRLQEQKALEAKKEAERVRVATENKRKKEEAERKRQDSIKSLLTKAQTTLLKTRLSSNLASADSKQLQSQLFASHNDFKSVLRIDPKNKKAISGIDQVAQQFLDMAEREATRKNYDRADDYMKSVIEIAPSYKNIVITQNRIDTLRNEQILPETETPEQEPVIVTEPKPTSKNNRPSFGGF